MAEVTTTATSANSTNITTQAPVDEVISGLCAGIKIIVVISFVITIWIGKMVVSSNRRRKLYLRMDEVPIYKTVQDSNMEHFVDLSLQNETSFANLPIHGFEISVPSESIGRRTNLDRFLENLFSKKIEILVDKTFISDLQTILEDYVKTLFVELMELQKVQRILNKLQKLYNNIDYESSRCNDVLHVGSFYEDTKNTFPDEFDHILVLLKCTARRLFYAEDHHHVVTRLNNASDRLNKPLSLLDKIARLFFQHVKDLTKSTIIIEKNDSFYLKLTNVEKVGPACKLCFSLKKKNPSIFEGDSINIHVDITPAIKVIDIFLPMSVERMCSVEGFGDEIVKTGSFIVIQKTDTYFTFTETEVSFMKNCLSTRHKRAYRLLKYLINGEMKEDQLRAMRGKFEISSYVLKTVMINHHYSCKNHESLTESHCVIDVLKTFQSCDMEIPLLQPCLPNKRISYYYAIIRHFTKELSELISTLMSLSNSTSANVLDESAIMPLSKRMYKFISVYGQQKRKISKLPWCCTRIGLVFIFCAIIFLIIFIIVVFHKNFNINIC